MKHYNRNWLFLLCLYQITTASVLLLTEKGTVANDVMTFVSKGLNGLKNRMQIRNFDSLVFKIMMKLHIDYVFAVL